MITSKRSTYDGKPSVRYRNYRYKKKTDETDGRHYNSGKKYKTDPEKLARALILLEKPLRECAERTGLKYRRIQELKKEMQKEKKK